MEKLIRKNKQKQYSLNLIYKRIRQLTIISLCYIFCISHVYAQNNFRFERITIDNGLSNNSINAILQTEDGFMWVATKDGLNRYDGQGFKVYKYNPADPGSLPENYVMSLYEDQDGLLWVGTWGGGLCSYNADCDNFIRYRADGEKDDFIQCLSGDDQHNIWFGTTEGGLFCLPASGEKILSWSEKDTTGHYIPSKNITSIITGPDNWLWLGTWGNGLIRFNPQTSEYKRYSNASTDKISLSSDFIRSILNDRDSTLIICTFKGLNTMDLGSGNIHKPDQFEQHYQEFATHTIACALKDNKKRLWLGSYDYYGLALIQTNSKGSDTIDLFVNEDDNPASISIDRIRCIYEDKKSNIWIGTENGLNKLPNYQPFRQYRHLPLRAYSIGGRVVSGFCSTGPGILWVGYGGGGFDKIDLHSDRITHFRSKSNDPNSLSNNDVTSMYTSGDGIIWISTMNGGLNQYDPVTGKFISYNINTNRPYSVRSNWIQQVLETRGGLFLIGTNSGLDLFDKKHARFHPFIPELKDGEPVIPENIPVNALFEDSKGRIWISGWLYGLYCLDLQEKSLTRYLPDPDEPGCITSNKIITVFEDSHNRLWFGTHSGGLCMLDENEQIFKSYTTNNGLPNDVVFGILEDKTGNLWISTMRGLARLNPLTSEIRVYDQLDGLINNQFNWRASFKNEDGTFFFGGINGFISFRPEEIRKDTIPPQVAITNFKVFNKETAIHQSFPTSKSIELKHNQNFFSVEFTALDMAPSQKHRYMYMLEGIDPEWVESGTRTTAFYTDIRHGAFRFLVKACNADDIWSEPVSMDISVLPAWWNRLWVKILGLLSIFGIGILFTRLRLWHLLEIERIRLNIARDLHDEMGSNLSSISVDSQQLIRSKNLSKEEKELAGDIYRTTNETIDSIRDIIWFINPKNDGGENLIFKMRERAASVLAGKNWTFHVSEDLKLDSLKLEVRRNIFLIFKESLTNVVRHSKATLCDIFLRKTGNELQIEISDNGKGFDVRDTKKQGGLQNIYYRAGKIHARVVLKSESGKGTSLSLFLPMKVK